MPLLKISKKIYYALKICPTTQEQKSTDFPPVSIKKIKSVMDTPIKIEKAIQKNTHNDLIADRDFLTMNRRQLLQKGRSASRDS